jgi:2-polyprenyl-6-methoxyphenol hydroxylase-like FAD-dependent oxidoreductase
VHIRHGHRIEAVPADGEYDLIVAADGVNSSVRDALCGSIEPSVRLGRNWWAWFGTDQLFPAVSLIFVRRPEGLYIGHAYAYAPGRSGFVVEVPPEVFVKSGFQALSEDESRRFCTEVFADYLGGHELLSNRSLWFQPKFVTCQNWSIGNVTLLGDALHTVHPSIGSGTRFAMRDAVALAGAVTQSGGDPTKAIRQYETIRRPIAEGFQRTAMRSIAWYEGLADRNLGDPGMFGIEFAMRTGSVRWKEFRQRNPQLVKTFEHPVRSTSQ